MGSGRLDLKRLLDRIVRGELDEAQAYRLVYDPAAAGGRRDRDYEGEATATAAAAVGGPGPGRLECPVCGTVAPAFLPFGLHGRPNARCPGCGSVERHRMLWLFLGRRADLLGRGARRVLHTAPEPCLEPRLRARYGAGYVTLDRFSPRADVRADLKALPFADGRFDLVISSHVLEHVADDRPAIAELGRVLRPGGRAVIMVPLDPTRPTFDDPAIATPEARLAAYGHPFHFRIYGHDLVDRLAAAGIEARILSSDELFSEAERRRHRINANHLLDCEKPA